MDIKRTWVGLLFIVGIVSTVITHEAAASEYVITQIREADTRLYPGDVSNGQIAWMEQMSDDFNDYEILFYDGASVRQLTDNTYYDSSPVVSDGEVFWFGRPESSSEVFHYDGATVTQLTNTGTYTTGLNAHGGQAVWASKTPDTDTSEIFYFDGNHVIRLTDNDYGDYSPHIHNGEIVWHANVNGNTDVFYFNGTRIIQLTEGAREAYSPRIYEGQVVWSASRPDDSWTRDVYLYNGSQVIQLTHDDANQMSVNIAKDIIAWKVQVGKGDYELYVYEDGVVTQMPGLTWNDGFPSISDGQVAWFDRAFPGEPYDIFVYRDGAVTQLTDDTESDLYESIDGEYVAWVKYPNQLFMARRASLDLAVEYRNGNISGSPEKINPYFRIENRLSQPIDLSAVTLRYWYTDETAPVDQVFTSYLFVDESTWTAIDTWPYPSVMGRFVPLDAPIPDADTYLEISFSEAAGAIAPNSAVRLETEIHALNWAGYDESNDYSHDAPRTEYQPTTRVTLYYNNALVWGVEP